MSQWFLQNIKQKPKTINEIIKLLSVYTTEILSLKNILEKNNAINLELGDHFSKLSKRSTRKKAVSNKLKKKGSNQLKV